MKYYVVSDTHGFYKQTEDALRMKGFFNETEPHKLVICGDLLDRGREALKMQTFADKLLDQDKLIFIRGNHEDLIMSMISDFEEVKESLAWGYSYHISNGTFSSALQLTGINENEVFKNTQRFIYNLEQTPFISSLIPASLNYFETEHYVFVHGWIPCGTKTGNSGSCVKKKHITDWRQSGNSEWEEARWLNGMEMASRYGVIEPDKTIVCGHWNSSWGHANIEGQGTEFGKRADFSPYYGKGIIAIDACTAYSGKVNCIVLED